MTVAQGTPITHELKCWPKYYRFVKSGAKPFEIRKNDRGFQVGDVLRLREYDPLMDQYSGDECHRTITYTTDYEQRPGYVVLGLGAENAALSAQVVELQHDLTRHMAIATEYVNAYEQLVKLMDL